MSKSIHFFGQSVFGQLISLLNRSVVKTVVTQTGSDRYCKGFYSWDHLVSMLFCTVAKCNSLREVSGGCLGLKGKTEHLGLQKLPKRSTLSDANRKRSAVFFEQVYYSLLNQYRVTISDSRLKESLGRSVKIFDSTTISLFMAILKGVGAKYKTGKSKGGIKVHTLLDADENLPELIWMSSAATNDQRFWEKITIEKNAIYVFDKGYIDYCQYNRIMQQDAFFVTRLKDTATYKVIEELSIADDSDQSVIKDEMIELPLRKRSPGIVGKLSVRRIAYWDDEKGKLFEFVTNLTDITAEQVAQLYKQRWQIELLFKQFKQNFPLKYFLGDNENAIRIQIWCTLIANLLLTVIKKKVKRKWAFSNIVSFVRLHLFNYINLLSFLENPEKDWQVELFPLQLKIPLH